MTRTAPIAVRSAEISTATVEIKTVTVNRKQMTLAMFRQLRDEPLVSGDGKLNGNPWGSVNYHPTPQDAPRARRQVQVTGCPATHDGFPCRSDHGSHLHVIWQRGDGLLKSLVHEHDWCPSHHYQESCRDYFGVSSGVIQGFFCASGHRGLPGWAQLTEQPYASDRRVIFNCEGVQCWADVPSAPAEDRGHPSWARAWGPHDCATGLDALSAQLHAEVLQVKAGADAEDARRQQYTASWQAISDLPQLFIAA